MAGAGPGQQGAVLVEFVVRVGRIAHGLDLLLHAFAVEHSWVALNGWVVGAGVLAVAGAWSVVEYTTLSAACQIRAKSSMSGGRSATVCAVSQ